MSQELADLISSLSGEGKNEPIEFSESQLDGHNTLDILEETDDLESMARKLEAFARIVRQGKSLAVSMDYKLTQHQQRDSLAVARDRMNYTEIMLYDAWAGGATVDALDWSVCRRETPVSSRSASRFKRYAAAMQRIWKDPTPDEQNASWVIAHATHLTPLIKAVTKVIAAEQEFLGGRTFLSENEVAELQTVHKIVVSATTNLNAINAHIRGLIRSVNCSREVLQARENALKNRPPSDRRGT